MDEILYWHDVHVDGYYLDTIFGHVLMFECILTSAVIEIKHGTCGKTRLWSSNPIVFVGAGSYLRWANNLRKQQGGRVVERLLNYVILSRQKHSVHSITFVGIFVGA